MRSRWLLVVLLAVTAGCSQYKYAPVSGTITMDGKPLDNAVVSFQPMSTEAYPGPGSTGPTDAEGRYTLRVEEGKPGAIAGKHRVAVYPRENPEDSPDGGRRKPKMTIPQRYNVQSTLTFEVPAGGSTEANFALTSAPK